MTTTINNRELVTSELQTAGRVPLWRRALWLVYFAPVSIGTLSLNHSYLALFLYSRIRRPQALHPIVVLFLASTIITYLWGVLVTSRGDTDLILRQTLSFGAIFLPATVLVLQVPDRLHKIFDILLLATTLYACVVLLVVATTGDLSLAAIYRMRVTIKGMVPGYPTRYTTLLLLGFFYALHRTAYRRSYGPAAIVLLAAILLTVTRAAVLALFVGLALYAIAVAYRALRHATSVSVNRALRTGGITIAVLLVLAAPFLASDVVQSAVNAVMDKTIRGLVTVSLDPTLGTGSTADRITYWLETIRIALTVNPLFGTGYAGIGLFTDIIGSSHNQFLDVLLRMGLVGLVFHLVFWARLFGFYFSRYPFIFAGLGALFIYGIFHETTKLPYTALIFYLLINKTYELAPRRHLTI